MVRRWGFKLPEKFEEILRGMEGVRRGACMPRGRALLESQVCDGVDQDSNN